MICNIKDASIYYEEHGEGIPVLCIHGFPVDHRLMSGCLEPVFSGLTGYKRIYLDLPGMGKSSAPAWLKDINGMLDIVIAFVDEVIGDGNFLVIGESYGGRITQGLIHTMGHRLDGAFLLCSAFDADASKRILPKHRVLRKDDGLLASKQFMEIAVVATSRVYELFNKDTLKGLQSGDTEFLDRHRKEGFRFSFEDELKNLYFDRPTTILAGRQDHMAGYDAAYKMLENFPRATFAVLDCAGHLLQIENEALFAAHVKDWLQRISYGL